MSSQVPRRSAVWLAVSAAGLLLAALPSQAADPRELVAPPEQYFLEVDGKKVPLELDRPLDTTPLKAAKTVTLRVEPLRVFTYAGLKLPYPREFTFTTQMETQEVSIWILGGTDSMIFVERFNGEANHQRVAADVTKQLLTTYKDAKTSPVSLVVKQKEYKGTRIESKHTTALIRQDLYSFPAGKDTVLLILQDVPQANGKSSAEFSRVEKILQDSLELPK
jgi:hypothetical protein